MTRQELVVTLGLPIGVFLMGVVSGLLPVINAEAVLTAAVLSGRTPWVVLAGALALGQSVAKTIIFVGARHGSTRLHLHGSTRLRHRRGTRNATRGSHLKALARTWHHCGARLFPLLRRPAPGVGVVALSSVLGIPPLAATSVLAGIARMPIAYFWPACVGGRLLRFGLIAYPLTQLYRS